MPIESSGDPTRLPSFLGRKITEEYKGKLQSAIEDIELPNSVIRSHYRHGPFKQYVRGRLLVGPKLPQTT